MTHKSYHILNIRGRWTQYIIAKEAMRKARRPSTLKTTALERSYRELLSSITVTGLLLTGAGATTYALLKPDEHPSSPQTVTSSHAAACSSSSISPDAARLYFDVMGEFKIQVRSLLSDLLKTGVMKLEGHPVFIVDFSRAAELPELSEFVRGDLYSRAYSQLSSPGETMAAAVQGELRDNKFYAKLAVDTPTENRATVILINLRKGGRSQNSVSFLMGKLIHELSHYADRRYGLYQTMHQEIDVPYVIMGEQLSRATSHSAPENPIFEISPDLNALETVLEDSSAPEGKRVVATFFSVKANNHLAGFKAVPKMFGMVSHLLPAGTGKQFERFAAEVLCHERERIGRLNQQLARLNVPQINPEIDGQGERELFRMYGAILKEAEAIE